MTKRASAVRPSEFSPPPTSFPFPIRQTSNLPFLGPFQSVSVLTAGGELERGRHTRTSPTSRAPSIALGLPYGAAVASLAPRAVTAAAGWLLLNVGAAHLRRSNGHPACERPEALSASRGSFGSDKRRHRAVVRRLIEGVYSFAGRPYPPGACRLRRDSCSAGGLFYGRLQGEAYTNVIRRQVESLAV